MQGRVDAGPERVENRGWNSLSVGSMQSAGVGRLDGAMVQWCSGAVVQWCSGAVVQWCSGAKLMRNANRPIFRWACLFITVVLNYLA